VEIVGRLRDSGGSACRKYSGVEGGQRHFTRPPFNVKVPTATETGSS
jgi:hypothetical protein